VFANKAKLESLCSSQGNMFGIIFCTCAQAERISKAREISEELQKLARSEAENAKLAISAAA
jgi:hypothetical protein